MSYDVDNLDPKTAWQAALGDLQLQVPRPTFDTWLKPTRLHAYEDGNFIISTPNPYAVEWLSNRLHRLVKNTLTRIVGRSVSIRFIVRPDPVDEEEQLLYLNQTDRETDHQHTPPTRPVQDNGDFGFHYAGNPRYTFDTFVVGSGNEMAHAAAKSVAEHPAEAYNPLFIYGGVGLGKTHLLQAIANAVIPKGLRAGYISSEVFTNELINAILQQNTASFRDRYRTLDVLLIDDIQFIAGKESTQEEFFHTFNTLYGSNRQIIISSDRPPRAMLTLEERLRSRFEGGLVVDIQPPDLETRIAILRSKAEGYPVYVPDEVILFIARTFQNNIRELEGALTKVIAHSQFTRMPVTADMATQALRDVLQRRQSVRIEDIIRAVANYYEIDVNELIGKRRTKRVAIPRQIAMYLCREHTDASLPQIGAAMGGRDHTTILYGCEKVKKNIESDPSLRQEVVAIKESLFGTPVRHMLT